MADLPLLAHSLAEAYLYVMVSPCESCGNGPLYGGEACGVETPGGSWSTNLPGTCGACGATISITFQLASRPEEEASADAASINSTDEPSRIIDVGQWLTLFRMITEAATREDDKVQVRHLGMEAAQCLDEALKFYDDEGNDLPPSDAIFVESSRLRFEDNPGQFSRRRLLDLRSKLPTTSQMRSQLFRSRKKPWWRRGS
ncbi:MAG: hypothetical protein IID35_04685 [Planctomycetes bacterium]|nr:hypothetical protein [Planctomycetota bacterium]